MKKIILHPTDFSKCANNALEYAIMAAKSLDGELRLVHSLDFSGVDTYEQNAQTMIDKTKLVEIEANDKLQKLGAMVSSTGVKCKAEIFNGNLSSWLPEYIEEHKPILTVMGTTGAGSLANKIMGSNTFYVLKETSSPLMAVPINSKASHFNKIVFSTDYKDDDVEAICFVAALANSENASVGIVHVLNDEAAKKVNNQKLLDNLEASVESEEKQSNLNFQLLYGNDVHERLQVLLNETKPDLLALIMRKQNFFERLFFGSLTKKLVYSSEIPLLIFKAKD